MTRHFASVVFLLGIFFAFHAPAFASPSFRWGLWENFKQQFLQPDGRIIDRSAHDRTTSEGEAYTLFFALVAGDRPTFQHVLAWTRNNLAQGDLGHHLPAWSWGRRPDGTWGVLDINAASDADCWIAYSLIEAGRIWKEPSYAREGRDLLSMIEHNELTDLPGFGWTLLPGPFGFRLPDGTTRLNPSYLPPELLSFFAFIRPASPWPSIRKAYDSHLTSIDKGGFAPDWFAVSPNGRVVQDPVRGPIGSFDAIRVYLWAGILSDEDSEKRRVLRHLSGMSHYLARHPLPPLYIDPVARFSVGTGPPGFLEALRPYLASMKNVNALERPIPSSFSERQGIRKATLEYYDHVLSLFGEGYLKRRFAFSPEGFLIRPSRHHSAP